MLVSEEKASESALSPEENARRMPLRIGLLMDHPSPHMTALLEAVAARTDCMLEILYCGKCAPGRNWGNGVARVPHRFVNGLTGPLGIRFNPGIAQAMKRLRVDIWVVNTIYGSLTTLMAAEWLRLHAIPWIFMNEPVRPRPRRYTWLKGCPLRFVLNKAGGVIATGKAAVEMYRQRLRQDRPCESVPYYVDLSAFFSLPNPAAPVIGEDLHFVTSCQLVQRKGIDFLLQACNKLPETGWHLTVVGDGPLRSKLEAQFDFHIRAGRVTFVGSLPYSTRASMFENRHVLVFPSRWDGWGMVVPEALAAGLPVISTDRVMSAHEFIQDGKNGFIVPVGDSEAMAGKMRWFMHNPSSYLPMSCAARASLLNYRPDRGAEILVGYLRNVSAETSGKKRDKARASTSEQTTWKRLTTPQNLASRATLRMRRLAKSAVIHANVAANRRRRPRGNIVVAYHLVLKEDRRNFEEQLRFVCDHFRVSSLTETLRSEEAGNTNEFRLALTFDDGFRILMQDCLEVLEKHRIPASFFVPTAFVAAGSRGEEAAEFSARAFYYNYSLEPMTPDDLRILVSLGHEVGSHGVFHSSIHALVPDSARRELAKSRSMISEWTGIQPDSFSYPYGESSNSQGNPAAWIREAGFSRALTFTRGCVGADTDPFAVPRNHLEGNWSIRQLQYFLLR